LRKSGVFKALGEPVHLTLIIEYIIWESQEVEPEKHITPIIRRRDFLNILLPISLYSKAFKQRVVAETLEPGVSVAAVAPAGA